jgi:hypothetical protein
MIVVADVYTPDEMLAIHRARGWTDYIWSSAHARRMQAAQAKLDDAAYAAHVKALEGKK